MEDNEFINQQELWQHLIDGGTIHDRMPISKTDTSDHIHLVNGMAKYHDGRSAQYCLLTYTYWLKAKKK